MGFTGSATLVIVTMVGAGLWGMTMANRGWGWGHYHPLNQTEGPKTINVGGSENWHFNPKMVHSTSMIL
ncbi:Plastocyanin-like protein [Gossypium australe]|uniref:Plastocyanin-like protein n=1 Tax=Gossypium australe TaxID=47621 RepID=A0A5B6X4E1_9ROSI|nr:Plastocyanin-like protein [Gossypium australe]